MSKEIFCLIPGFPGYRVSNRGRVQSCRQSTRGGNSLKHYSPGQWYDLKPNPNRDGHINATIYRDVVPVTRFVHSLVAECFLGPRPPGMICLHRNDDPSDNRVENLRWGTHQDNVQDMIRNGRMQAATPKQQIAVPLGAVLQASPELLRSLGGAESFLLIDAAPGYKVSNWGRVQSCRVVQHVRGGPRGATETVFSDQWHDIKPQVYKGRYHHASLTTGTGNTLRHRRYVHDLVLTAFVGPRPVGLQCRHINGDGFDNRLENLAWGTPAANMVDQSLHGTLMVGEKNHAAKLTPDEAREIRGRYGAGDCRVALASEFGVSIYTIWRIGAGKSWKNLSASRFPAD